MAQPSTERQLPTRSSGSLRLPSSASAGQALFFLLMARPLNGLHYAMLLAPCTPLPFAALVAGIVPRRGSVPPLRVAVALGFVSIALSRRSRTDACRSVCRAHAMDLSGGRWRARLTVCWRGGEHAGRTGPSQRADAVLQLRAPLCDEAWICGMSLRSRLRPPHRGKPHRNVQSLESSPTVGGSCVSAWWSLALRGTGWQTRRAAGSRSGSGGPSGPPGPAAGLKPRPTGPPRTRQPAGRSRTDCDRRRGCRCGPRSARTCEHRETATGTPPVRGSRDATSRDAAMAAAVCGAFFSTLSVLSARALHDLLDLLADLNHRIAEAIELALVLALRRLDHQRARHRKRHGRRVEAIVDQPLGDVHLLDAGGLERRAGRRSVRARRVRSAGVQHRIVRLETRLDVVRVQDRDLGGARSARRRPSIRM